MKNFQIGAFALISCLILSDCTPETEEQICADIVVCIEPMIQPVDICECECPGSSPNCGAHGTLVEPSCNECMCDEGWTGEFCDQEVVNSEDYNFSFEVYDLVEGQEVFFDSVRVNDPDRIFSYQSGQSTVYGGCEVLDPSYKHLLIDLHEIDSLESFQEYFAVQVLGIGLDAVYQDLENPAFWGTAFEGSMFTGDIDDGEFNASFEFTFYNGLQPEDTFRIKNGEIRHPF